MKGQRRQNGWVSPFDWRQQGGNGRNSGSCGPQPASKTAFPRLRILLEFRRKGVYTSYTLPGRQFIAGLNRRLRGHYNYYGLVGNLRALWRFYQWAIECAFKWLNRRGGKRSSSN